MGGVPVLQTIPCPEVESQARQKLQLQVVQMQPEYSINGNSGLSLFSRGTLVAGAAAVVILEVCA